MSNRTRSFWRPAGSLSQFMFLGELPGGGQPGYEDATYVAAPDVYGSIVRFTVDKIVHFVLGQRYDIQFVYMAQPNTETNDTVQILNALLQETIALPEGHTAFRFLADFVPYH